MSAVLRPARASSAAHAMATGVLPEPPRVAPPMATVGLGSASGRTTRPAPARALAKTAESGGTRASVDRERAQDREQANDLLPSGVHALARSAAPRAPPGRDRPQAYVAISSSLRPQGRAHGRVPAGAPARVGRRVLRAARPAPDAR